MEASFVPDIAPKIAAARQQALAQVQPQKSAGSDRLRKQAEDFEHVFLTEALKTMFSGLQTDGPFGGGFGEEQFREMLVDEYAGAMVKAGGVGIADEVYRQLLQLQEDRS